MTSPAKKNKVKSSGYVILRRALMALLLILPMGGTALAAETMPTVRIDTTEGVITVRLRPDVAPATVANFLEYVKAGYYDGTVFHRVIPGFMIQGGGYTADLTQKSTRDPVVNEASKSFGNVRGSIAMARTNNPDSATSQFFINLVDNDFLNKGVRGPGYTAFGTVVDGMGAVDAIASVPTARQGYMADVPVDPVTIRSVELVENSSDQ